MVIGGVATNYSQTLGGNIYSLTSTAKGFTGSVRQQKAATSTTEPEAIRAAQHQLIFECSAGVRVVTTADNDGSQVTVIAVVGIDNVAHQDVRCTFYNLRLYGEEAVGIQVSLASVKPNEVWHWPAGYRAPPAQLQRAAKFVQPHP
eukprot:COSAG01_NODE_11817_length_1853_cov_13.852971_1_plen_146_part_00